MKSKFLAFAASLLAASISHATTYYWDGNGDTAGFAGATGTWASPTSSRWTTTTGGTNIQFSITTTTSDDLYFGTDTVYMTTGTVTVSGTVNAKTMTFGAWGEGVTFTGGTINLGAAATITVNNAHNQAIGSALTGAATSLTKSGGGIVILSSNNTYAGKTIVAGGTLAITGAHTGTGEITLNGGILNLGNGNGTGSLAATVLNVNGGEFRYTRNDSATQSFTTTNVNSTQATFVVNTGNTLNLGTVNRTLGTTPSLSYTGTGTLAALTDNNVGGIMPGFHSGNSWVVANGPGNKITQLASYTQTSVAGTNASNYTDGNIDVNNSAGTLNANINANSLRFNTAAANTLSLSGSNSLATGGILVGSTVGNNLSTISGGTLSGANGNDLHIIQNNTSNGLTIASTIAGLPPLTKSGPGLLTLSANNSFTGGLIINAGQVILGSTSALNSTAGSENAITFTTPTQGTLSLNGNSVTVRSLNGAFAAVNNFHAVQNNHSFSAATLTIGNGLNLNSNFEGLIQNGSAGATLALVKKGTGTLTLGGTVGNTYTGGTTIHAGTVVANNGAALGPAACTLTFAGDSTLQPGYDKNPTFYQNVVINSGVTAKFNEINQYYSMTFNGPVSGSGTLWIGSTDNGQGNTSLNNASNTHTGILRIGDGTRDGNLLVSSLADGAGAIELGGTTGTGYLKIQGLGAITLDSRVIKLCGTTGGGSIKNVRVGTSRLMTIAKNLEITGDGNKTLTLGGTNLGNNAFNGFIPDGAGSIISFTKEDFGKWILSKTANTYSGPTKIMDGLLEIKKLSTGGVASSIGQSGSGPKNLIFGPGPGTGQTPVEGILRYTGAGDSTDRNFILLGNATLDASGSGPIVFSQTGIISPSVPSLTGTFYLGNPVVSGLASTADFMLGMAVTSDAFSGTKIITAITSSTITLDSGTGIQFGTFGLSVGYVANRILRMGGAQTGANTISGILQDSPNHSSTSSPGVLNILKQDAGTWRLDGLNTYTGTTTVNGGTLEVNTLAYGGQPSSIGAATSDAGKLLLGNTTTLRYTGNGHSTDRNFTINGISAGHQATINSSGTGPIEFTNTASPAYGTNNQTRTLNLGGTNTGANILAAKITNNGSGAVSVVKNDSGTWMLAGDNTYTGTTTINGGTLLVSGSLSASSAVIVNGAATLGGNGTYAGSLTLAADTNLAPGAPTSTAPVGNMITPAASIQYAAGASIGTLSIGGNLNISAMAAGNGKLQFELGALNTSDRIAVGGTLSIGSAALGFNDFTFTRLQGLENGTYTLISSNAPIGGTLNPADLSGHIGNGGTGTLQVSPSGTSIELVITVPPFYLWSDDALFGPDNNGDGISNGLAFMLGAPNPEEDAAGLLPRIMAEPGGLVMSFNMRKADKRGNVAVLVQHSGAPGLLGTWTEVAVPDADGGPTQGITFKVSQNQSNADLNDVTATISSSEEIEGKLFGRLKVAE